MAFYEREFIEIRRENYKMEIVGTLTGSVEREDVRDYMNVVLFCVFYHWKRGLGLAPVKTG